MPQDHLTKPDYLTPPPPAADEPAETDESTRDDETTGNGVTETGAVPTLEVRVLGTVEVAGLPERLRLRKSTELVTYLAFHRNGAEPDTIMEALWPEQEPNYPRLNQHASRARTTLGHDPDGALYLPYITNGIYRISPHLGTDLDRFTSHIRHADQTSEVDDEIGHLQDALVLVAGTPFSGIGNAYTWAHTDGIITHSIVAVDNAAHRIAQLALQTDAPDQATWAARKGLTATTGCEQCYRNLMAAANAADNPTALEAIYTELLAIIDADGGPDASTLLDPETVQIYEQHNPQPTTTNRLTPRPSTHDSTREPPPTDTQTTRAQPKGT